MRICILIPTYRRNISLVRLLSQIADLRGRYVGSAALEVVVTDSDRNNPAREHIEPLCDRYVTNPGRGFDDNLFHFYRGSLDRYDCIFSISDNDLFPRGTQPRRNTSFCPTIR